MIPIEFNDLIRSHSRRAFKLFLSIFLKKKIHIETRYLNHSKTHVYVDVFNQIKNTQAIHGKNLTSYSVTLQLQTVVFEMN